MKVFRVKISGRLFGINADYVFRVLDGIRITPVPSAPDGYLGVTFYRGELFDVVDLASIFWENGTKAAIDSRYLILKWGDRKLIVTADGIQGLSWEENSDGDQGEKQDESEKMIDPEYVWARVRDGFRKDNDGSGKI